MSRKRPGSTASHAGTAEALRLRAALLRFYGADEEFMRELGAVASAPAYHPATIYRLARRFGLDRLGPDPLEALGDAAQDDAAVRSALRSANNPAYHAMAEWVDLARRGQRLGFPATLGMATLEPDVAPVTITVSWDVTGESRDAARARAHAAVASALERIETTARAAGYVWTDTHSPEAEQRHLLWLYLRIRHGMTWAQVADAASETAADAYDDDAITKGAKAMARRAQVDIRRDR